MTEFIDSYGRKFNLRIPIKISITQTFNELQPNHFGADLAASKPIIDGDFIGSIAAGGSCNVNEIKMVPHCNGTHTESVGHIVIDEVGIDQLKIPVLLTAALVTLESSNAAESSESYRPPLAEDDHFVSALKLKRLLNGVDLEGVEALIVRTLPNDRGKLNCIYGKDRQPAFFSVEAMEWIFEQGFDHLLVDLPSLDRMYDDGKLTCHHIFWNVIEGTHDLTDSVRRDKSVTELIFVPEVIEDGIYLLNLQVADWANNSAASRPIIFPMIPG